MRTIQRGQTHRGGTYSCRMTRTGNSTSASNHSPTGEKGRRPSEQLRRRCKTTAWRPFTQAELQQTSHTWANNKSTGPDGISHEAARALLAHPVWGERLLYVLTTSCTPQTFRAPIDRGITVLLPKVPAPWSGGKHGRSLCPPARGDTRSGTGRPYSGPRKGRQGIELIATLRRVTTMARDWGVGTYIVKLDVRKAFDSVWQHSMSELVAARLGRLLPRGAQSHRKRGTNRGKPTLAQHPSDARP